MKNIGLNLGQRKKLINYINYSKAKIDEEKSTLKIPRNSTQEEVSQFLKEILKFSDETIEALDLDGISFFAFSEEEIDGMEKSIEEQKENYKNYLKIELKRELPAINEIKKEEILEEVEINEKYNKENNEKNKNENDKKKRKMKKIKKVQKIKKKR